MELYYKNINCCQDPHQLYNGEETLLKNVIIGPHGAIYDENGNYIISSNSHFEFWYSFFKKENEINNIFYLGGKELIEIPEENILLCLNYFNHYPFGHLWDNIQPIIKFKNKNFKILCNLDSKHINNLDFHFSVFGFKKNNRIHIDTVNKFYKVKKLLVPQLEAYPAHISSKCFNDLQNSYINSVEIKNSGYEKIFLTRYLSRLPLNKDEIYNHCIKNNIKILNGTEPFEDLVSFFYSARIIYGIHGSLFKHCIFNKNRAKIYEFAPDNRHDHSFKQNSKFVTNDYNVVKLKSNEKNEIYIPLELIK